MCRLLFYTFVLFSLRDGHCFFLFYWTIVQVKNEQKRWKMNNHFENQLNIFFTIKNINKIGRSWTINEQNKNTTNAPISCLPPFVTGVLHIYRFLNQDFRLGIPGFKPDYQAAVIGSHQTGEYLNTLLNTNSSINIKKILI